MARFHSTDSHEGSLSQADTQITQARSSSQLPHPWVLTPGQAGSGEGGEGGARICNLPAQASPDQIGSAGTQRRRVKVCRGRQRVFPLASRSVTALRYPSPRRKRGSLGAEAAVRPSGQVTPGEDPLAFPLPPARQRTLGRVLRSRALCLDGEASAHLPPFLHSV